MTLFIIITAIVGLLLGGLGGYALSDMLLPENIIKWLRLPKRKLML